MSPSARNSQLRTIRHKVTAQSQAFALNMLLANPNEPPALLLFGLSTSTQHRRCWPTSSLSIPDEGLDHENAKWWLKRNPRHQFLDSYSDISNHMIFALSPIWKSAELQIYENVCSIPVRRVTRPNLLKPIASGTDQVRFP
jgi:hypothetical protein